MPPLQHKAQLVEALRHHDESLAASWKGCMRGHGQEWGGGAGGEEEMPNRLCVVALIEGTFKSKHMSVNHYSAVTQDSYRKPPAANASQSVRE